MCTCCLQIGVGDASAGLYEGFDNPAADTVGTTCDEYPLPSSSGILLRERGCNHAQGAWHWLVCDMQGLACCVTAGASGGCGAAWSETACRVPPPAAAAQASPIVAAAVVARTAAWLLANDSITEGWCRGNSCGAPTSASDVSSCCYGVPLTFNPIHRSLWPWRRARARSS